MPLSIRDTQAFTNVPNSRNIGELASLYETEALIQGPVVPNGAQGITDLSSLAISSNDVLLNAIQPGSSGATTIRFSYNQDTKRYVMTFQSPVGYMLNGEGTDVMRGGSCEKF